MIDKQRLQAILSKSPTAQLLTRAANFLADQARRNFAEARQIKAQRGSAAYVRRADQAINMIDTSNALQQIAANQCPRCEYCGAGVQADRMLCENCNDLFADVTF